MMRVLCLWVSSVSRAKAPSPFSASSCSKFIFIKQWGFDRNRKMYYILNVFIGRVHEFAVENSLPYIKILRFWMWALMDLEFLNLCYYNSCSALLWSMFTWSYNLCQLVPGQVCWNNCWGSYKATHRAALKKSRLCSKPLYCKSRQPCESETIISRWH